MPDKITKVKRRKVKRTYDEDEAPSSFSFALCMVLTMIVIGIVCIMVGLVRHGFPGWSFLATLGCIISGIGFVVIGTLPEYAWIEWIIGFADGLISGLSSWFWTRHLGTLSDNVGERGASVLWVIIGFPTFIVGCLMALRIIPV